MARSKKKPAGDGSDKKLPARRIFFRADYNVLESPIFDPDNRSDAKTMAVVKSIRRGNDTITSSWIARSERELPKAFDKKVLYVFFRLYEEQGFPSDGRVRFTFFEVAKHLDRSYNGETLKRIEEAIHSLRAMTIEAANSWFDGELKAFQQDKVQFIQMIADAYFSRSVDGQLELEKSWVQLGAHVQSNIRAGAVKMLNLEVAMSIRSPLALRLFEILSKRRNKAATHNTQLSKLAESIPMKSAAVSRQLQLLKGPHEELIEKGIISAVKVTGEGKQKILVYTFPTGENVTLTEAEARRIEAVGSERIAASADLDTSQPLRVEDLNMEIMQLICGFHHLPATAMLTMNNQTVEMARGTASVDRMRAIVEKTKVALTKDNHLTQAQMLGVYMDNLRADLIRGGAESVG